MQGYPLMNFTWGRLHLDTSRLGRKLPVRAGVGGGSRTHPGYLAAGWRDLSTGTWSPHDRRFVAPV